MLLLKWLSILKDYALISLKRCQRQAHNRYSTALAETDPIPTDAWKTRNIDPAANNDDKKSFYDRVHSQVVAEWLRNVLTSEDYEKLMRKKKHFTFTDDTTGVEAYDGPTMLLLTFRLVEPNTIVGVETLRAKLKKLRMHMVNNDVNQACDEIERLHRRIEQKGKSCESILRYTIETLMSGPHDGFTRYISRFNDDIESETGPYKDMKWTDIIASARVKWNNMVEQGVNKQVNPQDAKILALTTKIKELGKVVDKKPPGNNTAAATDVKKSSSGREVFPGRYSIEKWRGTKEGDTKVVDGRTYYWCPHHKADGLYDGLYVSSHKAEDHFTWKQNRYPPKGKDASANGGGPPKSEPSAKLSLNDRLKSVLSCKLMLSDADVESICKEVNQEN